jgi:hypothetical protein
LFNALGRRYLELFRWGPHICRDAYLTYVWQSIMLFHWLLFFLLLIFIIFFHSAITDENLRNAIITQMLSSREVITRHYLQLQGVATAEAAKGALDILAPCLAQLVQNTPATEFISTE